MMAFVFIFNAAFFLSQKQHDRLNFSLIALQFYPVLPNVCYYYAIIIFLKNQPHI